MMYQADFESEWEERYDALDKSVQPKIWKKVLKILDGLPGRHLQYGSPYFVEEAGQYRICYKSDEEAKIRRFYFVGTHKDYLEWIHGQ